MIKRVKSNNLKPISVLYRIELEVSIRLVIDRLLTDNYNANINKIFGDGIIETSTSGSGTTSWHSAYSGFVGLYYSSNCPFFLRGGFYLNTSAGSFSVDGNNGNSGTSGGFRVCLAVR